MKFFNKKSLRCLFLIFLFFFSALFLISSRRFKFSRRNKKSDFLKTLGDLKEKLINQGSEFMNIGVKFISKNNRFIVAEEDIPVILLKLLINKSFIYFIIFFNIK